MTARGAEVELVGARVGIDPLASGGCSLRRERSSDGGGAALLARRWKTMDPVVKLVDIMGEGLNPVVEGLVAWGGGSRCRWRWSRKKGTVGGRRGGAAGLIEDGACKSPFPPRPLW
ncbi:hypothetical protein ZWY2020_056801 [Hordeum vulgare]|nr:hypothetical protein ZWY2020_056801 [Hordeum vulgare]